VNRKSSKIQDRKLKNMLSIDPSNVYKPINAESIKLITPKTSLDDTKNQLPDDEGYLPDKRFGKTMPPIERE